MNSNVPATDPSPAEPGARDARAWWILAAATLGLGLGFGVVSSFAVFMAPLEAEFGWSRADVSLAYTLMTVGMAAGGLLWGGLADTRHLRTVLVAGAVVLGLGLFAAGRMETLLELYVIALLLGLAGFACLYTPLVAAVGLWFDRRRGLAIGIVTAGGALGQGVVPLLAEPLISGLGWREAYAVLGAVYLAALVPAMATVLRPPQGGSRPAAGTSEGRWRMSVPASTAWISAAGFFCCFCMAVPLVHVVPLVCGSGQPASTGAALLFAMMAIGAGGRIAFGMLADRTGALPAYALASVVQTVSVFWFVPSSAMIVLVPVALVFGIGFAGNMTGLLLLVRESVPPAVLGRVTGIVGFMAWLGMGAGGYAGGLMFDWTGDYALAFGSAVAAGAANLTVLGLFARERRGVSAPAFGTAGALS
ncbi:MFS transporter [Faunimonas sp. B44]|uniref:MFS transporter n=1 Tax=Faunimonas sp. B44 TaxID=3461493 RepID=UPI004044D4DF